MEREDRELGGFSHVLRLRCQSVLPVPGAVFVAVGDGCIIGGVYKGSTTC